MKFTTALLLTVLAASANVAAEQPFSLILENGSILDGSGTKAYEADIGVLRGTITAIGDLTGQQAGLRLDVSGLTVTPGFVDIHSHAYRDNQKINGIYLFPDAENYIRQGVTTVISGPDGSSAWPIASVLTRLEVFPTSINFGTFAGQGTIREQAMGNDDRAPTSAELLVMKEMVASAMEQGAYGLSSGLKYVPGAYAKTDEVVKLASIAGNYGGIYISHMRDEGLGLMESVKETIRIGEEGRLPTQITHHKAVGAPMWGKSRESLALVDAAISRGVDVSMDQYPYTASSTGIDVLIPAWALAGTREQRLARFEDPEIRETIKEGIVFNIINDRGGNDPRNVVLSSCLWKTELNGKNLAELLTEQGQEPTSENAAELVIQIVEQGGCRAVFHAMSEEDVERIMQHPKTMIASDGGVVVPGERRPHPRYYGAFARILAEYVRDRGVLSLPMAIHKMTMMPADRIKIQNRGRLTIGASADIAIFDPAEIQDNATFADPNQYAEGMTHVFINGVAVLIDSNMTGNRPGHVLRSTDK